MNSVSDLMRSPAITVNPQSNLRDAAKFMYGHSISALLVKAKGENLGILTESDLTRKVVGNGLDATTTPVASVMSYPLFTIDSNEDLKTARTLMYAHKTKNLVVTEGARVVGMLSIQDLLAQLFN